MTETEIRDYFLSKPSTVIEQPFHIHIQVFKVGNKIFGLINIDDKNKSSMNLKYHKHDIDAYRQIYDEIIPGYHMSRNNKNTVFLVLEMSLKNFKTIHVVSIFVLYLFIIGVVFQLYERVSKLSNYVEINDERIEYINKESLVITYVWSSAIMIVLSIVLHLSGLEKIGLGMSLSIPITFLIYFFSFE